jgi:DHA1 family bicyclomycin/chloramphenicol resistance-like MFS transporter
MAVVMTGAVWLGALVLAVLVRPWRLVAEQDEPRDSLAPTSS